MNGKPVTVGDIIDVMNEWAPPALAYEWDRPGLSIGQADWPARHVMTVLTVGPEAAEAAIMAGADVLVSHHPLIFEPLRALRTDDPHTALCLLLAEKRIACFSAHTNLDIAPGGVNDTLADLLGVVERSPAIAAPQTAHAKLVTFVPDGHLAAVRQAICDAGAGSIGAYSYCTFSAPGIGTFLPGEGAEPFAGTKGRLNEEPERRLETLAPLHAMEAVIDALRKAHPYEEPAFDVTVVRAPGPAAGLGVKGRIERPLPLGAFAEQARASLGVGSVRVVGDAARVIERVAVLGGSGGGHIGEIGGDVDVFVTGDINYHAALSARQRDLALIDAGHDGTESVIVPVMAQYVRSRLPQLEVTQFQEPDLWRNQ